MKVIRISITVPLGPRIFGGNVGQRTFR